MGLFKKLVLLFVVLVLAAGGYFYFKYNEDKYDPSKYNATITSAPAGSEGLAEAPGPEAKSPENEAAESVFVGLSKGAKVELTLPDQFDKSHAVAPEVQTLILALSKEAGAIARGFLDKQVDGYLSKHKALFIVDISPIPVVIRNSMVLPELQKRSYPFLLVYEEEIAQALRSREDSKDVAIVTLVNNIVQDINYAGTDEALTAAIP